MISTENNTILWHVFFFFYNIFIDIFFFQLIKLVFILSIKPDSNQIFYGLKIIVFSIQTFPKNFALNEKTLSTGSLHWKCKNCKIIANRNIINVIHMVRVFFFFLIRVKSFMHNTVLKLQCNIYEDLI